MTIVPTWESLKLDEITQYEPMGSRTKTAVIPEIYQTHLEEFQFLWSQWQHALKSPDYLSIDLKQLEDRIEDHVDGLLLAREAAIPILGEQLSGDEPEAAFAAAYVLLRLNRKEAAELVIQTFCDAKQGQLQGTRQALCHGPIELVTGRLQEALVSAPPLIAVGAAEALAFHRRLDPRAERITELLSDENPEVRRSAWRVVGLVDATPTQSPD